MKTTLLLSLVMMSSISSFAQDGKPVVDKKLFQSLQERYNGQWEGTMNGDVAAENLKDKSILVETSARFAEFAFYNIPKAKDDFLYVPSSSTSGWLNYHDRIGSSIRCGQSSYDLKKNPFPTFKCRFAVDAQGNVKSFVDRSAETSIGVPLLDSGHEVFDGWEKDTLDFHWRPLHELKGSANAYSENNVRSGSADSESFHLQIFDDVAVALYSKLEAKVELIYWGTNHPVRIKRGNQIWCLTTDNGKSAKCRIAFGFDGVAHAPSRN